MARMYRLLTSADMQQSDVEIKLYCMALRALKSAIESDNSIAADVLCAAQILAFFEVRFLTHTASYSLIPSGPRSNIRIVICIAYRRMHTNHQA